jgi:hypothetical protein
MRFDAYAASIKDVEYGYVAECLAHSLGGILCKGKPMRRFGEVLSIEVDNRMAAWVGFDLNLGQVYVEGKGSTSPQLAQKIRVHFPEHSVPRADVCEDYDEPGVFSKLQDIVRANKGPRVKGGYIALPDLVEDGKTWAAGVRGGVGYVRVYEAGKHPDRRDQGRPDWSRIEGEFRPHYARDKVAAARMNPCQFWGLSAWTHRVGEQLTQTQIERFEPEIRKYSFDKTTRYIANTFRRHLEEMRANGESIDRTFQAVWEEEDEIALRLAQGRRGG